MKSSNSVEGLPKEPNSVAHVAGIEITTASRRDLALQALSDAVAFRSGVTSRAKLIFDANGHGVSMTASDREFRSLMAEADVVHADGGFLVTASRFIGPNKIAERSPTTDMIHDIAIAAEGRNVSYFLLGGAEEVNRECAERLAARYPWVTIVGRRNGYFAPDQEQGVVDEINRAAPDVLWVGLGKPLEQRFSVRNRDRLRAAWIVTCGGCFNYITGAYPRAPRWMQSLNLEWLFRLLSDPRKLFVRYLLTSPHALWLTLKHAFEMRSA